MLFVDKLDRLKKAAVAAIAVAQMAFVSPTIPETMLTTPPAVGIGVGVACDISVQILYRPVLQEKVPDSPRQRGDKAYRWWMEQLGRIKYGWTAPNGHYLCGYHYWYLNFVKIPRQDEVTQTISGWDSPLYRDNDDDIMSGLWRARRRQRPDGGWVPSTNYTEAKPRTIGWTQMEFLGVDSYKFIFESGRERYIGRAYPNEKSKLAERQYFLTLYTEHLHPFLKTWDGQELEILTNSVDDFSVCRKVGKNKIIHNWIQYRIIPDENNAGIFKGMRYSKITAVEAGLWGGDSLDNFWVENKDSLGAGVDQWGPMVIGGTSNAIINKSSNYKTIFFNPRQYNATSHFTPKTRGHLKFIDEHTGRSLEAEALVSILADRKAAEGSANYHKELVQNPLIPQEAFEPSASFAYDPEKLQAQIGWVKTNGYQHLWKRGKLEDERDVNNDKTGRVMIVLDEENTLESDQGPWLFNMACLPRYDIPGLHFGAIDDTYKPGRVGQKLKKRDSRNCMIVWRRPTTQCGGNQNMPAAVYYERSPDMNLTYNEFLKGMRCYAIKKTLYEYTQWGFVNWLIDQGEGTRLHWIDKLTPGLHVIGNVKVELTALGSAFIAAGYYQRITCLPILESMLMWGSEENDDIGSALHLIFYLLHAFKDSQLDPDEYDSLLSGVAQAQTDFIRLGSARATDAVSTGEESTWLVAQPKQIDTSDFIRLGPTGSRSTTDYYDAVA